MQTTLLRRTTLTYFMDTVIIKRESSKQAVKCLNGNFLDDRARLVTDEMCLEVTVSLFDAERVPKNKALIYEEVLNNLFTQMSELADIRAWSGNSLTVRAKTLALVNGVRAYILVYSNLPEELQELRCALGSCVMELVKADWKFISDYGRQPFGT